MLAVPHRAELRGQAARGIAGALLIFAAAVALYALAGRLDDLNVRWPHAIGIPAAVLVAATAYSVLGGRMSRRLERMRPLEPGAEAAAPRTVRGWWLWAIGAGLLVGGVALIIDFELDNLAVVLAIGLGSVLGGPALDAWTVARHEREHGGTVYRVEDPPGTEAGLRWLREGRE
jgi:hypothetical protein